MMKYFSNLLFFYFCLFRVGNGEPSTAAIHLKILWKLLLKRRFLDDIKYLSFDSIRTIFHYADIDNTSRNCSARNNNLFTRSWVYTESDSSEYELIDGDIWDNLIFLHVGIVEITLLFPILILLLSNTFILTGTNSGDSEQRDRRHDYPRSRPCCPNRRINGTHNHQMNHSTSSCRQSLGLGESRRQ